MVGGMAERSSAALVDPPSRTSIPTWTVVLNLLLMDSAGCPAGQDCPLPFGSCLPFGTVARFGWRRHPVGPRTRARSDTCRDAVRPLAEHGREVGFTVGAATP